MKTIVFQSGQLSVRGTEIALFDYAKYNQDILGNRSVIAFCESSPLNDGNVIRKFESHFSVHGYRDLSDIDGAVSATGADLLYTIKINRKEKIVSRRAPVMVHEVFPASPGMFYGASYAFVSDWLSDFCSNGAVPAVPHIVSLPDISGDLRDELGIPADATVFGCHGGADSFDIPFAKDMVDVALGQRSDRHFIFLNIKPFSSHKRAIFLPGTAEMERKIKFINTCDAMLHARQRGESFGLACAEFSVRNKPVLTYSKSGERNHIDVLGDRAQLYSGPRSLLALLSNFDREKAAVLQWDCYSERFSPEAVMRAFKTHLIDKAVDNGPGDSGNFSLSFADSMAVLAHRAKIRGIKLSRGWAKRFS